MHTESKKGLVNARLNWLYLPIGLVFLVLAVRLWQLQIIQGAKYFELGERNRVRTIPLVAPRGTITDRNNAPLVENRPSFNILLYRESMRDVEATTRFAVERLGVSAEDVAGRLRRSRATGLYRPVVLKEDVGIDDISVVETFKAQHPEIQLAPEPRRLYRYGSLAAHLLGYVGEVSEEDLFREAIGGARSGDLVGKSGVERIYNRPLTGADGKRQVLVDSVGREAGVLDEIDSSIGGELQLTIDLDLQRTAEAMLSGKVGSIVAMDPRDGAILAMASAPSFDPNTFSARISEQDWKQLVTDPDRPLQNRAIQNAYPPGSTFKLIMAIAGLEEKLIPESLHVYCNGATTLYGRAFHCHEKKGHGSLDLEHAIIKSCNVFFYDLGRRMGISPISQHATELGFGERSGIDLPNERSGVMPSPEWKQQARGAKWFAGETISVSIGQGAVTVTPLQLLRAVSAIAARGKLATPHVVLRAERLAGGKPLEWPTAQIPIDEEAARRVTDGMAGSVVGGTSHNAAIPGVELCGKTGTVQVIGNEKRKTLKTDIGNIEDHAWFVGFGSRSNPEIAVVVFLEHGGKGGAAAAPLAREVFRTFYEKKLRRGSEHLLTRSAPEPIQISEARP